MLLNSLRRAAIAVLLLLSICVLPLPARAQVSLDTLHAHFSAATCLNDWDRALMSLQQMIGSESTAAQSRQRLIDLRYQLEDYRARGVRFDQSHNPACAAAIANASQPAPAPTQTFDWEQALQLLAARAPQSENVSPDRRLTGCSDPSTVSADGRCFRNAAARARHERSWGLGDRPAGAEVN